MTEPAVDPRADTAPRQRLDDGTRALRWWQRLASKDKGDPGTLAQLRRSRTSLQALGVRAGVDLARRLGATSARDWRTQAACDLARVLAHVKEHDPRQHPMKAAGWKRFAGSRKESDAGDDRPLLAESRFRRLLQTGDGEEKVAAFVRLVELLGGKVNVVDLANDFLLWNHPQLGERVRERWAFLYYAADDAAPPALTSNDPDTSPADEDDEA